MKQYTTQKNAYEVSGVSPPASRHDNEKNKKYYITEGFRNKTKGEGYFNTLTYTGVGYFGVTAFSIYLTYLLRDRDGYLAKAFKPVVDGATKFFSRNATTAEEATRIAQKVDSNMNIAALFTGGTVVSLLPIKWLEDHKSSIVKKLDAKIYGQEAIDNDPALIEAHKELDSVPRQTWRSVLTSRLLAFAATYSTSFLVGDDKSFIGKKTGLSIDRAGASIGRHIDSRLNRGDAQIVAQNNAAGLASPGGLTRAAANPDRVSARIWGYIAMDGFYTLITSKALFVFTRIFAPFYDKRATHNSSTALPPAPAALPTPASPTLPAPANDVAPAQASNDNPPSPQVHSVQAQARVGAPVGLAHQQA